MPTLKNILMGVGFEHKLVSDFKQLSVLVKQLKEGDFRIALTQGVFDMFHVGHGRYLNEARTYGDVLIVGVDSDELVRDMKGPTRPFDIFDERVEILSMLASVSIIIQRDINQHKHDLIRLVQPDVLIMSQTTSSFTDEDKTELDKYCGKIEHLVAKAATSTTAKMLRLRTEGSKELADRIHSTVNDFFEENRGS